MRADDGLFTRGFEYVASAIGGAAVTLVAFRTKIALMDRRIASNKTTISALEEATNTRLARIERRQMITLEIVADIARKVGVEGRFSDALVHFLTSEAADLQPPRRRATDTDVNTGESGP